MYRTLALTWLQEDLAADQIDQWDTLVDRLFEPVDAHTLRWRGPLPEGGPRIVAHLQELARTLLTDGPMTWKALCCALAHRCASHGGPEPAEVRAALADLVVVSDKSVRLQTAPLPA